MSAPLPIDRTTPPRGGAARRMALPAFERATFANGLTALAARLPRVPIALFEWIAPAGGFRDPRGSAGLATLVAALVDEGTTTSDALEIAARIESLGGTLSSGADWDYAVLEATALASEAEAVLALLAEIATSPTFPEREIERLKRQRLTEILRRSHDPSSLAEKHLARVLYGETPYGSPLLGTEQSVAAFTREPIEAFFAQHYVARGGAILAIGDLDPAETLARVEAVFRGLPDREAPPFEVAAPPERSGITIHLVDRPGASQTELRIGHVGIARRHPDWSTFSVLNALLGGKFTSRINLNLRERHGYTYGATSRLVGRRNASPFVVATAVSTESTGAATREVLFELRRIREELATEEELAETQQYLIGVFPYTLQTIGDLSRRLETLVVHDLADDHYERYLAEVAAVDAEALRAVAERRIDPERVAVVAVGPADTLAPQFEGLGPIEIVRAAKAP